MSLVFIGTLACELVVSKSIICVEVSVCCLLTAFSWFPLVVCYSFIYFVAFFDFLNRKSQICGQHMCTLKSSITDKIGKSNSEDSQKHKNALRSATQLTLFSFSLRILHMLFVLWILRSKLLKSECSLLEPCHVC